MFAEYTSTVESRSFADVAAPIRTGVDAGPIPVNSRTASAAAWLIQLTDDATCSHTSSCRHVRADIVALLSTKGKTACRGVHRRVNHVVDRRGSSGWSYRRAPLIRTSNVCGATPLTSARRRS